MERLTKKDSHGYYIDDISVPYDEKKRGEAIDRLAAYENTGLYPEEVGELVSPKTVEIARLLEKMCAEGSAQHMLELFRAEKDGRLVVLPCKVGDTVYRVFWRKDGHGHIATTTVSGLHMGDTERNRRYKKENKYIVLKVDGNFCAHVDVEQIGKTVFLTREEAEAASKKMEKQRETE